MMTSGMWLVGALVCLLATVVVVAGVLIGLRWVLDRGPRDSTAGLSVHHGPGGERID